ncbi:SMI1/KNR4 family protein [Franconibacter helveticus]|uniref:SMI1/KNR4 family protein n=1 Tax=Franconibacter helveticus TaxID=357240 RepID=UPI000DA16A97|nr:SMI1/KNR4 family protein [Franconibacter helveticus]
MNHSLYDELDEIINESGETQSGSGPASDELIAEYEKQLGVKFPESYITFLKRYGTMTVNGESFYGISKLGLNATSAPDVRYVTLEARKPCDIDNNMVLIKSSGYGPMFSIDTSISGKKGEAVIVETDLSFKRSGNKVVVARSFGDFICNEVKESLEDL